MVTVITRSEVPVDVRRGGSVQTLLSPRSVGSRSGFMGVASVAPGDFVSEHYHPYSEEFVFVVEGTLDVQINDVSHILEAGQALVIPINGRHRLVNPGDIDVQIVFQLGPLAPRPDLGHVDTETRHPTGDEDVPPSSPSSGPTNTPTNTAQDVATSNQRVTTSAGTVTALVSSSTDRSASGAPRPSLLSEWAMSALHASAATWGMLTPDPYLIERRAATRFASPSSGGRRWLRRRPLAAAAAEDRS